MGGGSGDGAEGVGQLFEAVGEEELKDDACYKLIFESSEEASKVSRNQVRPLFPTHSASDVCTRVEGVDGGMPVSIRTCSRLKSTWPRSRRNHQLRCLASIQLGVQGLSRNQVRRVACP